MADLPFAPGAPGARGSRSGAAAAVRLRVPVVRASVVGEYDGLELDPPYSTDPDQVGLHGEPDPAEPDPLHMEPPVLHGHGRSSRPDTAGKAPTDHSFLDEMLSERSASGREERQTIIHRAGLGLARRLPHALRGGLVDPAIRGALLIALVALVAALAAGWFAWRGRPVPVLALPPPTQVTDLAGPAPGGVAAAAPRPTAVLPSAAATGSPQAQVVVDVAGKVRHPGVFTLPGGSRVVDAVSQAGGVLPGTDTSGLALARRLVDGEQILVDGRPGPAPPQRAGGAGGAGDTGGDGGKGSPGAVPGTPLNLNTATVEALDGLPGVGPVLAQRIVEWREAHGGFTSPRQLGEVTGVGDQRLTDLLPLVTV
ncbi:soluble ligand binding domain-containing protein [Candidatus Protofrankia californiensis]|uniref:Soluble ligand binding domain-containing protein n=1 Tax=Candidatus Protofrankia californiensis TaxID=1839754 RepID=A0A1C3NXH0_9ACTN|nr:soluble ligand binding domain-containing protein [Candidatus Protofrankia californiensis]